jgi:hypothetical protein
MSTPVNSAVADDLTIIGEEGEMKNMLRMAKDSPIS